MEIVVSRVEKGRLIGYLPKENIYFDGLSVQGNLKHYAKIKGVSDVEVSKVLAMIEMT